VSIRVRLFAERDYPAFVRIKSLAESARLSVDDVRADHARYERVRVVSVVDNWGGYELKLSS